MKSKKIFSGLVVAVLLSVLVFWTCKKKEMAPTVEAEKYLFIWAGDQARKAADFLAVVNFDQNSADYGKIITTIPLPNPE